MVFEYHQVGFCWKLAISWTGTSFWHFLDFGTQCCTNVMTLLRPSTTVVRNFIIIVLQKNSFCIIEQICKIQYMFMLMTNRNKSFDGGINFYEINFYYGPKLHRRKSCGCYSFIKFFQTLSILSKTELFNANLGSSLTLITVQFCISYFSEALITHIPSDGIQFQVSI